MIFHSAFRGFERIRTAVHGFADRCLATRPRNPIASAKIVKIHFVQEVPSLFSLNAAKQEGHRHDVYLFFSTLMFSAEILKF